jgi:hypothetical protein
MTETISDAQRNIERQRLKRHLEKKVSGEEEQLKLEKITAYFKQQRLYFFPLPQGHKSLRPMPVIVGAVFKIRIMPIMAMAASNARNCRPPLPKKSGNSIRICSDKDPTGKTVSIRLIKKGGMSIEVIANRNGTAINPAPNLSLKDNPGQEKSREKRMMGCIYNTLATIFSFTSLLYTE